MPSLICVKIYKFYFSIYDRSEHKRVKDGETTAGSKK